MNTIESTTPWALIEFADRAGRVRRRYFRNPVEVIVATTVAEVRPALRTVEQGIAAGLYGVGYLAYEAAPAFERVMEVRQGAVLPLLWFGLFAAFEDTAPEPSGSVALSAWQPAIERAAYDAAIEAVRAAIGAGDTYQVNYTIRLHAQMSGDDYALYRQLCAAQGANYCAYLHTGRFRVLSASPELFFRWDGQTITTKPMKGTVARGRWPDEDEERAAWLLASEKNRAENLMIVDLLRNDLGRLALVGSVRVPELFGIERYRTVLQMTSTIEAQTRPGTTLETILEALFPCGSITGAPKIKTMELIAKLEDAPRSVYCGSIGLIEPGGETIFNVAIRTVTVDAAYGRAEYGVGGGITWDSTAADEYAEALDKAALLREEWPAFALLETMRLEQGVYARLDGHLQRLTEAACYFAVPLDITIVRKALDMHAKQWGEQLRRVRLLVEQDGSVRVMSEPLLGLPQGSLRVALAREPVWSGNRFLYHKTTQRTVYEAQRAAHPEAFDVLLWNERGELTEFTIGNLVMELDGRCWTPPRACGLLAGIMRGALLVSGTIHERILRREDLQRATGLWLINSLRGIVPVQILPLDRS